MTNRVVIDRAVTVKSVNGPGVTIIRGYQVPGNTTGDAAIRCVHLSAGAVLSGFTLTNGATRNASLDSREFVWRGVWCASANEVVTNCVLSGNAGYYGGGAACGTLISCTLSGNSAWVLGGGRQIALLTIVC